MFTFNSASVASGKSDVEPQPLDRVQFVSKTIQEPITVSGAVKDSKVVQYYDGIDLIDVLRVISLDGDPTKMKVYIYHHNPAQTARSALGAGGPGRNVASPVGTNQANAQTSQTTQSAGAASSTVQRSSQAQPQQPVPAVVYLDDFLTKQGLQQVPLRQGDKLVFAFVGLNEKAPQVIIRGEVKNPGAYLWKPGMRLSDLIKEAGDYTDQAYPQGLVLLRQSAAKLQ